MKKEIIRKEFLKLRIRQYSYSKCKTQLKELYGFIVSICTLKRWQKIKVFENPGFLSIICVANNSLGVPSYF